MSKREDGSISNDRIKRLRQLEEKKYNINEQLTQEIGKYTEGPLDPKFGQHSVFPNNTYGDEEQNDVFKYLNQVRLEAENDSSVHFAEIKKGESEYNKKLLQDYTVHKYNNNNESETCTIPSIIFDEVITKFLHLKSQIQESMPIVKSAEIQMILPETATQWRNLVHYQVPPPIEYFYGIFDHPTIIKLIVYFTKWLCSSSNEYISQWIWKVLLRLDMPLDVNECSIIRDLGKKALKLYQKMDENVSCVSKFTITMVLVIVSEYYGQKDLISNVKKSI